MARGIETIRNKKITGADNNGLIVNLSKFWFSHIYAFSITFKAVHISKDYLLSPVWK
jgi:hypothetical protein